jgi:hypothetical protein
MSAINPTNNSSNTHTPGSLTWSLTSLLRTLIHPHRSSHSLLPASFYVILSKFGVLPAVKVIYSATQTRPAPSASPRFCYLFTAHSPHPYLQISFHLPISPVQHRALYKKIIMLLCTICPWDPYTNLFVFLILLVCSRPWHVWLSIHWLVATTIILLLRSSTPSQFSLCVYFLRVVLSGLSPVVCLCLIGPRQRDICSAVLVLRNLQITEYFVPDLN